MLCPPTPLRAHLQCLRRTEELPEHSLNSNSNSGCRSLPLIWCLCISWCQLSRRACLTEPTSAPLLPAEPSEIELWAWGTNLSPVSVLKNSGALILAWQKPYLLRTRSFAISSLSVFFHTAPALLSSRGLHNARPFSQCLEHTRVWWRVGWGWEGLGEGRESSLKEDAEQKQN